MNALEFPRHDRRSSNRTKFSTPPGPKNFPPGRGCNFPARCIQGDREGANTISSSRFSSRDILITDGDASKEMGPSS
jgi:hypothetical protein